MQGGFIKDRRNSRRFGGAGRDRTGDLIVANDALSQLSYSPTRDDEILSLCRMAAPHRYRRTAWSTPTYLPTDQSAILHVLQASIRAIVSGRRQEALMATTDVREEFDRAESRARSFGKNIESDLAPKFIRVVENAAIASARTMGRGERDLSDKVAVESMRRTMDTIPMHARIVIGEGERDQAPMLYIGEKVGAEFRSEERRVGKEGRGRR